MVPIVGGWGLGDRTSVAQVVLPGGSGAAAAGPLGVVVVPQGAAAARVGRGGRGGAIVWWGAGEAWA